MRSLVLVVLLCSSFAVHAQGGRHTVRLESPRIEPRHSGNGLMATYYHGRWYQQEILSRIDPEVNFDWGNASPDHKLDEDYFFVRWEGKLYTPESGLYTFTLAADEGVKLWVQGKLLIDAEEQSVEGSLSAEIYLDGRQLHDIKLEYQEQEGKAYVRLYWQFGNFAPMTIISQRFLFNFPEPKEEAGSYWDQLVRSLQEAYEGIVEWWYEEEDQPTITSQDAWPHPPLQPDTLGLLHDPPPDQQSAHRKPKKSMERFEGLTSGQVVRLQTLLFAPSKYELNPTSLEELDKLAATLLHYKSLSVEIAGHTDQHPKSSVKGNLQLSEYRSQAVVEYLIEKGVSEERLEAKGYGGTQPVASNATLEGRKKNRRVEFRVK
ncbi:MAG: PA14 domain-containing protein [Bacteroidota bacterium]